MFAEALAGSLGGAAALMTYAVRGPSSTLLGPSVNRGSRQRRTMAITFDDGPSESTEAVLHLLQRHKVNATFFLCGANVSRLPEVARSVQRAGHEVGNHTQTHPHLYFRSPSAIAEEFALAQQTIGDHLGSLPHYMRPPFGVRWFGFRGMQRELNLMGVMWTILGLDWKLPASAIAARVRQAACNGAIVCLHDGRALDRKPDISQTLKALDEFLPALIDDGYRFETVTEILCPKH